MKLFLQIYKKLLNFFNINDGYKKPKESNDIEAYTGSITFHLTDKQDIDVLCKLPDISSQSLDEMTLTAEKYAEFLCYINDGSLTDNIFGLLKKNAKKTKDEKDQLFIDNILFFWEIIHKENQKKAIKKISGQPMIRPTEVFK
jgi:hypothetical protein